MPWESFQGARSLEKPARGRAAGKRLAARVLASFSATTVIFCPRNRSLRSGRGNGSRVNGEQALGQLDKLEEVYYEESTNLLGGDLALSGKGPNRPKNQ